MIDSIMFLMVKSKLDVTFTTSVASRFGKNSSHLYIEVVKTTLRYLKGLRDPKIIYGSLDPESFLVEGYSNSD